MQVNMMTEALTTLFENHEIRAIEQNGDLWFPLVDLATAWGINTNTVYQILARNSKKFQGFFSDVHVICTTPEEHPQFIKGVNEQGLYLLLGAVNTDRLKNKEAGAAILRFQRWVPELIRKYRKKEIVQVPVAPGPEQLKDEMQKARLCAQETQGSLIAFQKIALERCGLGDYAPALDVPVYHHGEKGWFIPSELVPLCNDPLLNAERLNQYLKNNPRDPERRPYQYRDENHIWRLTPLGMEHGREITYTARGGHTEPRIEWRSSILYASGLLYEPAPSERV